MFYNKGPCSNFQTSDYESTCHVSNFFSLSLSKKKETGTKTQKELKILLVELSFIFWFFFLFSKKLSYTDCTRELLALLIFGAGKE